MSNIETGGPAFPCDNIVERNEKGKLQGHEISSAGISIRDYFAAKAIAAIVLRPDTYEIDTVEGIDATAANAYAIADAMLKARSQ